MTERPRYCGALLAAGGSKRFGSGNKLLAAFGEERMIRRTAQPLNRSKLDCWAIVCGDHLSEIACEVDDLGGHLIQNRDWKDGLSSSIGVAVGFAKRSHASHLLIALADMPFVSSADINTLIAASQDTPDAIIRAMHRAAAGHPVIFPQSQFDDLLRLRGDQGARQLLEGDQFKVIGVETGQGAVIDIDTQEALARHQS